MPTAMSAMRVPLGLGQRLADVARRGRREATVGLGAGGGGAGQRDVGVAGGGRGAGLGERVDVRADGGDVAAHDGTGECGVAVVEGVVEGGAEQRTQDGGRVGRRRPDGAGPSTAPRS